MTEAEHIGMVMDLAFDAATKPADETEDALDCLSDSYTELELFAGELRRVGLVDYAARLETLLPKLNHALYVVGKQ